MASDFDKFLLGPQAPAQAGAAAPPAAAETPDASMGAAQGGAGAFVPGALQALGAGAVQGGRDIYTTASKGLDWAEQNVPALRAIDPNVGPSTADLQTQTAAAQDRYGSSPMFTAGRIGSQMLLTAPLTGLVGAPVEAAIGGVTAPIAARALATGAPRVARVIGALPAAAGGAVAGGGTNALVAGGYGENPLTAGAVGALGGGAVGGGLGYLGSVGAASQGAQAAQRLGVDLTAGQRMGGFAKGVEDLTQYLPFSGASGKALEQNQQLAQVLARNIGVAPTDTITRQTLNDAELNAGRLMDQSKNITLPSTDQQLVADLARVRGNATMGDVNPTLNILNHIDTIMANNNGSLPGDELHNLISYRGTLDNQITRGDKAVSGYAGDIKEALMDAAQRTTANNPAFSQFQQGRQFWKAIKTIEPSIEKQADGSDAMSLQGLKRSIQQNYNMRRPGEMQDVADAIQGPLAALPSSGTGRQNLLARLLVPGIAAGEAGGIGALAYLNPSYVANVALPAAGASMAGRAMRYGPGMGPGWGLWRAYQGATNPLAPRLYGPAVGNLLTGGQAPSQQ